MMILTGCKAPEVVSQGEVYDPDQDHMIGFENLKNELEKNGIDIQGDTYEDDFVTHYNLEDDSAQTTILVDTHDSLNRELISQIFISAQNVQTDLSQHPVVKSIAAIMEEEKIIGWVKEVEEQRIQAGEDDRVNELLVMDRCYLDFKSWSYSDGQTLEFTWAKKPRPSAQFQQIAAQLEDGAMITTGYIEGPGGQSLIATNSDYYYLTRSGHWPYEGLDKDVGQAAAYRLMSGRREPNDYSIQLYGYMKEDLSYTTKVEEMPGLYQITQWMNMDNGDFLAVTDKINKELTKARELQNYNTRHEYYVEGDVGAYHYTLLVPAGMGVYNFTVLIETKSDY